MAISPGIYIRMRREAAGLSIGDVALALSDNGAQATRLAAEIALLEADETHATRAVVHAMAAFFPFDPDVYERLVDLHLCGPGLPEPQLCRECACSFHDPCCSAEGENCGWAEPDLCTECVADPDGPVDGEAMPVDDEPAGAAMPHPVNDQARMGIAA